MESNVIVNKVLQYVDKHLEEPISIEQIAKYVGYSEYHFLRMFKSCMNMTIMEYVNRRKLIKASEDILNGVKVIDVAFKYGWQSHSGFTKAFKKEFGFYPSLLRAALVEMNSLGGNVMNHVFLETTKKDATKEELFEILQVKLQENGIEIETEKLDRSYQCACKAYEGVMRYSGNEYITHLLNISITLTELNSESDVICAGMFCDVVKKGKISLEQLENELPKSVMDIVYKLAEFTNEFSTASEDVIIIKLAERLHNMRTIEYIDESKRLAKAEETVELFMPLARKLDNKKLINELNDLCMKYYTE